MGTKWERKKRHTYGVSSAFFLPPKTGDGEEREIKKVRMKKGRERKREVTALGI